MPPIPKKKPQKPLYRVPTMPEITAIPWNGLNVVSTFAGCGGSSLGYRMAGFRVLWANEFVEAARDCYRANMSPGTIVDNRDIREIQPEEILKRIGLKIGELDLLDGSPPCASFSTAGKRQKDWGKAKKYSDRVQRTDDLFWEFVRILRGLKPRVFVAENVSGLVKGVAKGYFLEILKELKDSGYRVKCKILDAQWLGVPQARQRTIFVGVREDLTDSRTGELLDPVHPSPLPWRWSVRDALPHLVQMQTGSYCSEWRYTDEPMGSIVQSDGSRNHRSQVEVRVTNNRVEDPETEVPIDGPSMSVRANRAGHLEIVQQQGAPGIGKKKISPDKPLPIVCGTQSQQFVLKKTEEDSDADISRFAIGDEWDKIDPGKKSDRYLSLIKTHPDEPSPTVTQTAGNPSAAGVVLHIEKRKFFISELKRICAFPDDFLLLGTYAQQWERLGRAVPPLMMRAIAEAVRDGILIPSLGEGEIERRKLRRLSKPLLIGQSPSRITDSDKGSPAFIGVSGAKLASVIGMSQERMLEEFEAINLLDRFEGRTSENEPGDNFDLKRAKRAASLIRTKGRIVILAGSSVAEAFDLGDEKILQKIERDGTTFVLIPHPSSINKFWNSKEKTDRVRQLLRSLLNKIEE